MDVNVRLHDHTVCGATIKMDGGDRCSKFCDFFTTETGDAYRCALFGERLGPEVYGDSSYPFIVKRCASCIATIRKEMGKLSEQASCTIIVQRNFERARYADYGNRLTAYEVELNTAIRSNAEYRITFTNDGSGSGGKVETGRGDPVVVVPLVLDMGTEDES
jgi:hypothetical protein